MCKKLLMILTALCLAAGLALAEEPPVYYTRGQKVADFTLTTCTGETITLYEVLEERDIVLLHFWSSTCGGCEEEFPLLQEAYAQYNAKVEVIAVTIDQADTDEKIAAYAQRRGLTFPVARDTAGLSTAYPVYGVPMSVVIDRFGTLCYIKEGAMSSADEFMTVFEAYVGEPQALVEEAAIATPVPEIAEAPQAGEASELTPWGSSPQDIPSADPAQLAEALNAPGGALVFTAGEAADTWPMILAQDDAERMGVTSTNVMQDGSTSAIVTTLSARAGDALSVTFALSSEEARDRFLIRVNGEVVKAFSGERARMAWAWQIPADGDYTVELAYTKDEMACAGEDGVFIEEVAHLTGDAAAAALAANAAYPTAGAVTLNVVSDAATQIAFDDPTYALLSLFGLADYYIVPEHAQFLATLTEELDPEEATVVSGYDNVSRVLAVLAGESGYAFETPVDSPETTGYTHTVVQLYPYEGCGVMEVRTVVCFSSEAAVEAFITACQADGMHINGWDALTVSEDEDGVQEFANSEGNF